MHWGARPRSIVVATSASRRARRALTVADAVGASGDRGMASALALRSGLRSTAPRAACVAPDTWAAPSAADGMAFALPAPSTDARGRRVRRVRRPLSSPLYPLASLAALVFEAQVSVPPSSRTVSRSGSRSSGRPSSVSQLEQTKSAKWTRPTRAGRMCRPAHDRRRNTSAILGALGLQHRPRAP